MLPPFIFYKTPCFSGMVFKIHLLIGTVLTIVKTLFSNRQKYFIGRIYQMQHVIFPRFLHILQLILHAQYLIINEHQLMI